jgi:hypothetical protein
MPRLRLRISNLLMLLIIIALVISLATQRRREADLIAHLRFLNEEHARQRAVLETRHGQRANELTTLQEKLARLIYFDESTIPDRMVKRDGGGSGDE